MTAGDRWSDLTQRVASAVVMVCVAAFAVWTGGLVFELFIGAIVGAMVWELSRMLAPEDGTLPVKIGLLCAGALFLAAFLPPVYALPILIAPALVGVTQVGAHKGVFLLYTIGFMLAGYGFHIVRVEQGMTMMLWLVLVVVATDVAGYFAGKAIGGPKFWPRVSPKKTWSGTAAGWVAAGLVGIGFAMATEYGALLVLISVLTSMASQAGDMAESAIKRKMGVKDASNLIPGHGGFMDRFDGMMGAALFVLLVKLLTGFA